LLKAPEEEAIRQVRSDSALEQTHCGNSNAGLVVCGRITISGCVY